MYACYYIAKKTKTCKVRRGMKTAISRLGNADYALPTFPRPCLERTHRVIRQMFEHCFIGSEDALAANNNKSLVINSVKLTLKMVLLILTFFRQKKIFMYCLFSF